MPSKSCLYTTSRNKFTEKNLVANNLNSLASVVTLEIHTDNKAGSLGMWESSTSFRNIYVISSTPSGIFVQSHRTLRAHIHWSIEQLDALFSIIYSWYKVMSLMTLIITHYVPHDY